jgi:hypothetical protein
MKLVMTLLVRNEADIVDAQIAFHLSAGVDFVIATDNRSEDGTTEILERYEQAGRLLLLRESGDDMRQGEWVTRMARLAATDFGADWVINSDADEFWWPRGGSLKDVLAAVPERYGVIRGAWRHFLPRPVSEEPFSERMTVRLRAPAFPSEKRTIFHAHQKVAHRATADVVVENGNHGAEGIGLEPLRAWHPLEVLHFSIRSPEQIATKSRGGWLRNEAAEPVEHQARLAEAGAQGEAERFYLHHAVTDDALARGLAAGRLATDTRLRDVLRLLRDGDEFRIVGRQAGTQLAFSTPTTEDSVAFLDEISPLLAIDGIVRAEGRADALATRIELLERSLVHRLPGLARLGALLGRRHRLTRR